MISIALEKYIFLSIREKGDDSFIQENEGRIPLNYVVSGCDMIALILCKYFEYCYRGAAEDTTLWYYPHK